MNLEDSISYLKERNQYNLPYSSPKKGSGKLKKVLVANRAEIAKKFFETLYEENIPSVAIVTDVDLDQSWYEMANEVVFIGDHQNYFNIDIVIAGAILSNSNAIYPGYGFLSENYHFVKKLEDYSKKTSNKIIFMGPPAEVINKVGNKLKAREIAKKSNVLLFSGSNKISNLKDLEKTASRIGYPLMVKLNAGGGGRGIIPIFKESQLMPAALSAQRLGKSLYKDDSFYIEKYITKSVHIEVQIFNHLAIAIRKCALQRNHQKLLEENGECFLDHNLVLSLFSFAESIAKNCGYSNGGGAGTVEFLLDAETGEFGFLEVNPRLQVEYAVTEQALEVDIVKWQILYFDGREDQINFDHVLKHRFQNLNHSIECRIYAEDPENNYLPSPGKLENINLTTLKKVRCDFGFGAGDTILPDYDNLIGKVIASGKDRTEAINQMIRALKEIYIKGVDTNISFFMNILRHPVFIEGNYTNSFLENYKEVYDMHFDNEKAKLMAMLGTISSHANSIHRRFLGAFFAVSLEDFMSQTKTFYSPETYKVSFGKGRYNYQTTLIQIGSYSYHVFIDNLFYHLVTISPRVEQNDNFLIKRGSSSFRLKLDVSKEHIRIKVQDDLGQVDRCKMRVILDDPKSKGNLLGMKRAPFQCQFVKLYGVKINDKVQRNQPIITVSAMKMETTVNAPVSGRIEHLIENGDIAKLELDKTPDGLVIGRSIKEGELLFSIVSDAVDSKKSSKKGHTANGLGSLNEVIKRFYKNIAQNCMKSDRGNTSSIYKSLYIIKSYLSGLIYNQGVILPISDTFSEVAFNLLEKEDQIKVENKVASILNFYITIQEVHSYGLKETHANFDEMSAFYLKFRDNDFSFQGLSIKPLLDELFEYYSIIDWEYKLLKEPFNVKVVFWYMSRAFHICRSSANVIQSLIKALSKLRKLSKQTDQCLQRLISFTQVSQIESLYHSMYSQLKGKIKIKNRYNSGPIKKWTVEEWVHRTFDPKSFREVKIKSIDFNKFVNPKTGKNETKRVGSRIYLGNVNGHEACFYMKDSRISGGATGNLEGLKYTAACFISYFKKIPLYIWNDGAGANIKEGIISLNRAAQGFMLNSIIGERFDHEKFRSFIFDSPDRELHNLFNELHSEFSVPEEKRQGSSFIVSVGIGSSTGLDVYGSSQSAIQVMLDTESSFRVLTGSNVIKSVTGEAVSNYEIGGAKVMGHSTGTVDLIAKDREEIIGYVKKIQAIFCGEKYFKTIQRKKRKHPVKEKPFPDHIDLLNEEMIKDNVDNGLFLSLKEDYRESNSILGGFARLGGRHVMVIGLRTHFGVRSLSGIIKVEELTRMAHKTGSSQIFIFGRQSYHRSIDENSTVMRGRRNLIQAFSKKSKLKIYILLHINALFHITINSFSDIIIFVKTQKISKTNMNLVDQMSTFVVNSLSSAFDLSHRLINLLDPIKQPTTRSKSVQKLPAYTSKMPRNVAEPFDIVENVILKISDKESFVEFYKSMNDKIFGPSLITGIAEFVGRPTGIIADQPIILGGAPESVGTEKFRVFVEFLQKNNLPLLMLSNSPGFLPGKKQELLRIQQIGGKSLDVNVLCDIPVVSLTLNQNYGGRLIHAFGKHLRPGIVSLAFVDSVLAVMGSKTSFDLFLGKKYQDLIEEGKDQEASQLKDKYMDNFNIKAYAKNDMYSRGGVDWLIQNKEDLTKHIVCALELADLRRQVLNDTAKLIALKKRCLGIFANIYQLHNMDVRVEKDGVYLKHEKKEISFEKIQDFIRGYQAVPKSLYETR